MTTGHTDRSEQPDRDQLIEEYLRELEREAERLPWNARLELLEDVRSHIEVALAESTDVEGEPAAGVRRILEALGEPREIVDAAVADQPTPRPSAFPPPPQYGPPFSPYGPSHQYSTQPGEPPYRLGAQEMFAIGLLLAGAFVVVIGWFVGVLLLWTSPRWNLRERLVGTFVVPGGLGGALFLAGLPAGRESCTGSYDGATQHCTSTGWSFPQWIGLPLFLLCLAAPIVTAFYLARRAQRRPGAYPGARRAGGGVVGMLIGLFVIFAVGGVAFAAVSAGGNGKQRPATPAPVSSYMTPVHSPAAPYSSDEVPSATTSSSGP